MTIRLEPNVWKMAGDKRLGSQLPMDHQ